MELSEEIQSLLQKYKPQATNKCDKSLPTCNETDPTDFEDDIIDVDQIDMSNDELWLQDTEISTYNLNTWLHNVDGMYESSTQQMIHEKSKLHNPKKNIDSRTFTRPKKKFTRPSIEKYNEDYFDGEKPPNILSNEIDNYISSCEESEQKPLHFDLSQPTYSNFFDRILASAKDTDSFQNMSPPSLVNSMCSSTFTNLMDNSLIRNDPVLREIRDADYSQDGLIFQETEAPLYQSFTESCSSINSDAPENFLRKTLPILNGTFSKNNSQDSFKMDDLDGFKITINEQDCSGDRLTPPQEIHTENIDPNITVNLSNTSFNGTYRKGGSKFNSTYDKIDENINGTFNKDPIEDRKFLKTKENMNSNFKQVPDNKERESLEMNQLNNTFRKNTVMNTTFHKAPDKILTNRPTIGRNNLDCAFDKIVYDKVLETEKKQVNDTINLKRLSLEIDDYLYEKINNTFEKARSRNSIQLSADSTDSLDRISTASNSSRDSRNHMMAEVEAIVLEQERSLQVMSTPKPSKSLTKLFDNNCLSPIPNLNLNIKGNLSDSEISSEEYTTVRSSASEKPTNLDRNVKSLSNLKHPFESSKLRGLNTMALDSKLKGSYSNLRGADSRIRGSYSNLKTLNTNLRSSYTNLRPFNSNLPNIPPKDSGSTGHMGPPKKTEVFKTPQLPKETSNSANGTFVKPQSRISSLPRPVTSNTGIPRPSISKIPGPKTTRSAPTRQIARPSSKVNVNDGYY